MTCVKCSEPRYSNSSYCKGHHFEIVNDYKTRNKEKINAKNREYMRQRRWENRPVGLRDHRNGGKNSIFQTKERHYQEQLSIQDGRCWICGATDHLVRDHNHITGALRGWLCTKCNTGIGMLQESESLFIRAIEYLEFWNDA